MPHSRPVSLEILTGLLNEVLHLQIDWHLTLYTEVL